MEMIDYLEEIVNKKRIVIVPDTGDVTFEIQHVNCVPIIRRYQKCGSRSQVPSVYNVCGHSLYTPELIWTKGCTKLSFSEIQPH